MKLEEGACRFQRVKNGDMVCEVESVKGQATSLNMGRESSSRKSHQTEESVWWVVGGGERET